MPKLQLPVPKEIFSHLAQRVHQRHVSLEDLQALAAWVNSNPTVPEGNWYKDFGTFKLAGTSEFAKTFLTSDMPAYGVEIF